MNGHIITQEMDQLTDEQKRAIEVAYEDGMGPHNVSSLACKLSLTRSYVASYIKHLNSGGNPCGNVPSNPKP
jgi:DNA-binding MarR family transcriptional regulator